MPVSPPAEARTDWFDPSCLVQLAARVIPIVKEIPNPKPDLE
jgi:hypothetical protein